MTTVPLPWLPAPSDGDMETVVGRLVGQWQADWIADPAPLRIESIPPIDKHRLAIWREHGGVWLCLEQENVISLGHAACASCGERTNPLDRQVLEAVGEEMLFDLGVRCGGQGKSELPEPSGYALKGDGGAKPAKYSFRFTSEEAEWSLALVFDESCAVRARKTVAGSGPEARALPLAAALADEEVRIGCHLGMAMLSAAEVAALTAGDVIVFDRSIDTAVPITIEGSRSRSGEARVDADDHAIRMTLLEKPDLVRMD